MRQFQQLDLAFPSADLPYIMLDEATSVRMGAGVALHFRWEIGIRLDKPT